MTRESEDEYICKNCGAKIERRTAFSYDGLCKQCYEKEEKSSKKIY